MASPLVLGLLLLFLLAALGGWIVLTIREGRRAALEARIKTVVELRVVEEEEEPKPEREGLDRRVTRLMRGLPANYGEKLEAAMATTGGAMTSTKLIMTGAIAIGVTLVMMHFFNFDGLIAIGIALAAGYMVPLILFRRARNKYRLSFLEVFPDALDLIARIVRAGVPVSTGIEVAGNESPEPVRTVFAEISSQGRVGISFEDSLNRMVKRLNIADFSFFASALVLQRESGGNIAETVSNLSAIVRKRKELRKKGEALTAEARTVAGVLGALPFAGSGLVALVDFDYIKLLVTDPRGNMIMGCAAMMLLFGMAIMRGMVNRALR
jgi:tight adherence protein B